MYGHRPPEAATLRARVGSVAGRLSLRPADDVAGAIVTRSRSRRCRTWAEVVLRRRIAEHGIIAAEVARRLSKRPLRHSIVQQRTGGKPPPARPRISYGEERSAALHRIAPPPVRTHPCIVTVWRESAAGDCAAKTRRIRKGKRLCRPKISRGVT